MFKSGLLKELLRKRIQYWEALLKRMDLRSEEEEQMVLEEDMGPRIVSWSEKELKSTWSNQEAFPLVVGDEGTVLLTVQDIVLLKRQKARDGDSDRVDDDDDDDNRGHNKDNDSEHDIEDPPVDKGKSREKLTKERETQKATSMKESLPTPTLHVKVPKPAKAVTQKPGPSKPSISANSRRRALLAQSSATSRSRGKQGPAVDRSLALSYESGGHVQTGSKRKDVHVVEERGDKKKRRKL
ncbi:hypothetical protein K435DRAFT_807677 [Dendrothele bispora CBS 962.96]|uniref:Uncharacterized protein n=1 Tax=Dendrothele bispora (strain CBS 962.96) TaxID=1314807 RepID=A0A4S8L3U5_DENBC|nr:hypothetical protein K435DRAFT_807677 [Dendrothele bispora CBS 962.96]